MRRLLPLLAASVLLAACAGITQHTAPPASLTLGWETQPAAPGPYDMPRTAIALSLTGALNDHIQLGTYSGTFSDARDAGPDLPKNAILVGTLWWAGAGDELIIQRTPEGSLQITHVEVDEQGGNSGPTVIQTIPLPPSTHIDIIPSKDASSSTQDSTDGSHD